MGHLSKVVDRPIVSVIASGESSKNLSQEEILALQFYTTVICLNFKNNVVPHVRYWRDVNVSKWMAKHPKPWPKLVSRRLAFGNNHFLIDGVDELFHETMLIDMEYELKYTAYHIIRTLHHDLPDAKVLLVGYDCLPDVTFSEYSANGEAPYRREGHIGQANHLKELPEMLHELSHRNPCIFDNYVNCSPSSTIDCIRKMSIIEALISWKACLPSAQYLQTCH